MRTRKLPNVDIDYWFGGSKALERVKQVEKLLEDDALHGEVRVQARSFVRESRKTLSWMLVEIALIDREVGRLLDEVAS